MKVSFDKAGKRFNREWIFRNLSYQFESGTSYVILGSNGSGKSTLLQAISGYYSLSEGAIEYTSNGDIVPINQIFRQVSIATPYLELYEEFSLTEAIDFHKKFKRFKDDLSTKEFINILELDKTKDKAIKNFSSGMKMRVRLGLAILSDTPILLLDEPTSNLDKQGIRWYQDLIAKHTTDRLVVVCSNQQEQEYEFTTASLNIEDYK